MTPAPISVERLRELQRAMETSCTWEAQRDFQAAAIEALPALLQQLAELEAELEKWRDAVHGTNGWARKLNAAERAREAAERDALRYRWVRACDRKGELAIHVDTMCEGELLGMEQLDAAIDAASGGSK